MKKEIDRWKEEVKVQESKSSLSCARLKSEVDAHRETREKLDKLLTETRAENEKIRSEYGDFIKKLSTFMFFTNKKFSSRRSVLTKMKILPICPPPPHHTILDPLKSSPFFSSSFSSPSPSSLPSPPL